MSERIFGFGLFLLILNMIVLIVSFKQDNFEWHFVLGLWFVFQIIAVMTSVLVNSFK